MKKRYKLILEFEAEINEEIPEEKEKRFKYFEKLIDLFIKRDCSILEIYRSLVMADLANGNHICDIEKSAHYFKDKDDNEIVEPIVRLLPCEEKDKFLAIIKNKDERTDEFFEDFFDQFGDLEVRKVDFLEI